MNELDLDYEYAKKIDRVTKMEERFMSYYCTRSLTPILGYVDFQGTKVVSGDSIIFSSGKELRRGLIYKTFEFPMYETYTRVVFLVWDVIGEKFTLKFHYEIARFTP